MKFLNKIEINKYLNNINNYLFHNFSDKRSIILTFSMLLLYIIFYFLFNNIYSIISSRYEYFLMTQKKLIIFFLITTLPFFFFFFFKLNIWTNFWQNTEKPHYIDYLFFIIIISFFYISFSHLDMCRIQRDGYLFLKKILYGENTEIGTPYLFFIYFIYGIWSIPVMIFEYIFNIQIDINNIYNSNPYLPYLIWWYRVPITIFYIACAHVIYKIAVKLNFENNKAKWISFIWIIFPVNIFSVFIYGQTDSICVFFMLIMFYFFIKKNLLYASLACMVAIIFKPFPIFIYLPLLLLFEKKILKILGYIIITVSMYLFAQLTSNVFFNSARYEFDDYMIDRLFTYGIEVYKGTFSIFIFSMILVCIIAFFTKIDNKDNFVINKYIFYIPLFVFSMLASFINFHPYWIIYLTPFIVFNIFLNKNVKALIILSIGINIGTILNCMAIHPKISILFSQSISNIIYKEYNYLLYMFGIIVKLTDYFITFGGRISLNLYISIYISLLLTNIILSFPNKKNLKTSRDIIISTFNVERDIIWLMGLTVMLWAVINIFLYFSTYPYL